MVSKFQITYNSVVVDNKKAINFWVYKRYKISSVYQRPLASQEGFFFCLELIISRILAGKCERKTLV
jgi:hypothetical protein